MESLDPRGFTLDELFDEGLIRRRIYTALAAAGIERLGELEGLQRDELATFRSIGTKSLFVIDELMERFGLSFVEPEAAEPKAAGDNRYEGWEPDEPPIPKRTGTHTRVAVGRSEGVAFLCSFLESGDRCWSKDFLTNHVSAPLRAEKVRGALAAAALLVDGVKVRMRGTRVYVVRED